MPDRDRVAFIIFILFYFIMNGQKKVEMQSQDLLLKETRECTLSRSSMSYRYFAQVAANIFPFFSQKSQLSQTKHTCKHRQFWDMVLLFKY